MNGRSDILSTTGACVVTHCARRRVADAPHTSKRVVSVSAWLPLIVLTLLALFMGPFVLQWVWMWLLALSIYAGCKWLTWSAARDRLPSNIMRSIGYLLAWPGMDAPAFLSINRSAATVSVREWTWALTKVAIGITIVWGFCRLVPNDQQLLTGWLGMIGVIFALHLGVFHVLSLLWRSSGVDAQPIFNSPLSAQSVGDFWSGRWNLAFRDLSRRFILNPLSPRWGGIGAMMVVFIVSGLLHDVVISMPARGGYGLPTTYFLLQGMSVMLERSRLGTRLDLRRGPRGRIFAILIVAGPAFWLFHPPFVVEVFIPFLRAIGAL